MGVLRKVAELGELSEAERQLINELDSGEDVILGDGEVPEVGDESRRVRAALIRLLLLGNDLNYPVHEKGIRIFGGWFPDKLDLEGCHIACDIALIRCRLDSVAVFRSATISSLFLNETILVGIKGDRMKVDGGLALAAAEVRGELRLSGAQVGGNLQCDDARFGCEKDARRPDTVSFCGDRLKVAGDIFLRQVVAYGTTRLPNARIGGSIYCHNAVFSAADTAFFGDSLNSGGSVFFNEIEAKCDSLRAFSGGPPPTGDGGRWGTIRLLGAKIDGDLVCVDANIKLRTHERFRPTPALTVQGAEISGSIIFSELSSVEGVLDFALAKIGSISDRSESWPHSGDLLLDGCIYGRFSGNAPTSGHSRIAWLDRQKPAIWGEDFWPQPYEQCAKVLREMGHGEDARVVLIEKDRRQREARLARSALEVRGWLRLRDRVLWHTVRHGRQPLRAALWLGVFWAIGTVIFFSASDSGAIKPNNAFMLRQTEWTECAPLEGRARLACFEAKAPSYPEFNAVIYSADTLLPIVSLEMQGYWIPDDSQGVGWLARGYLWLHIAVGWALSLLAVAGFSGLVKSD